MLDIQFIRENTKQVEKSIKHRGLKVDLKSLLELDVQRRGLLAEIEELRRQRNEIAAQPKQGKPDAQDIERGRAIKDQLERLNERFEQISEQFQSLLMQVPNILDSEVPLGGEDDGEVVRTWGVVPKFDFEAKDHESLGELNGLFDLKTAAQTSGSRFYYLKDSAVLLEFALVQWLLNKFVEKGFSLVSTPLLVRENMMVATGFFPAERNEIYQVNPGEDDLYLIGTSEVTLAGLHMFNPLKAAELPRRYVGFSTCFRREAGSYGKDVRGIFRVHQFDKLEMYSYAHPDKSEEEHQFLLSIEEEILQELELPYRVINIASGDLGAPAAKKYDCEVWIPSEQRYRELTSCSNTTDFQARRGNIKFEDKGEKQLAHTLNGTAMAFSRTLVAIIENYQTAEGKIRVPKVLNGYMREEYL